MARSLLKEGMGEMLGAQAWPDDEDRENSGLKRLPVKPSEKRGGGVAKDRIEGGDTTAPDPEALRQAHRDVLLKNIRETISTVGMSTLARELAVALESYALDDENPTLAGAQQLLTDIRVECDWGKAHIKEAFASHFPQNRARQCICDTVRSLHKRFGNRFTFDGAVGALDTLKTWSDAIKSDLRIDAIK